MKNFIRIFRIFLASAPFPIGVLMNKIYSGFSPAGLQLYILKSKYFKNKKYIKAKGVNVLITPIWGFAESSLAVESILAIALKNQGANTEFLACGGSLKYCMWDSEEYLSGNVNLYGKIRRKVNCLECTAMISSVSKAATGKEAVKLTDYKFKQNTHTDKRPHDLNHEHSKSSTLRKLLVGELSDSVKGEIVYQNFYTSYVDYRATLLKVFEHKRPDRIIMTHGIYLEHGTIIDLCHEYSIPVYVYGLQYRKNTISIVKGDTYHRVLQGMDRDLWDICIDDSKKKQLFGYIGSKLSGGRDIVNYHPNPIVGKQDIISKLNLNIEKPIITLFTNVLWDANIYYSSNIFEGMLDAIYHVILYFYTDNERQLIIRVHPAESKGGFSTNLTLQSVIEEKFPDLPNNIQIVPAESDISSYVLAEISDLNIIYASNIGTELCALGHKVMVLGEAYCRGRGFTVDPDSQDQVWEFLNTVDKDMKPSDTDKELAMKFAYFWFFKLMIDFNFFDYSVELTREMKFKPDKLNLLLESGEVVNDNLREITNAIIEGRDFKFNKFNMEES
jgi:hypothetical protein